MSSPSIPEGAPENFVGLDFQCDCGKRHTVRVKHVSVGSGVLRRIPATLHDLGLTGRFALVYDRHIEPIARRRLFPVLDRPGVYYDAVCFEKDEELYGSVETSDEMRALIAREAHGRPTFLMVMGSGTMNDLTKWAATVMDIPYIAVATAPSMNGYTSSIAALSQGGFKTTQDITPPVAVFADVDVLRDAPLDMIRAGLGDLLSKNVCNADWRLSHLLRGTYFCDVPHRLTHRQEEYYLAHASELGGRDARAVGMLTEAIMNSGFSMAIVGESSPSSGAEHLISHYWEMQHELAGKPIRLHGAQVGVGTLIAAEVYDRVLRLTADDVDLDIARRNYKGEKDLRKIVDARYGPVADRTFDETRRKVRGLDEELAALGKLKSEWDATWRDVGRYLRTRGELEAALEAAGAPTRASDLGFTRDETADAIRYARLMRNRYTVLDLADALGRLDAWADEIAAEFTS
ncbi:MAG TPA: sn-glycerol-1-phosphate dehydrogenase [Planctomycetota bacterium]|nr:sn-glycerol-1-phosphate dehydrogenase [Planctomycetota bacterium]